LWISAYDIFGTNFFSSEAPLLSGSFVEGNTCLLVMHQEGRYPAAYGLLPRSFLNIFALPPFLLLHAKNSDTQGRVELVPVFFFRLQFPLDPDVEVEAEERNAIEITGSSFMPAAGN
jgi:hypothetical protein